MKVKYLITLFVCPVLGNAQIKELTANEIAALKPTKVLVIIPICGSSIVENTDPVLCDYQATSAQILGRVVDAEEEIELYHVTVSIPELGVHTYTDEQGRFRFKDVLPGKYTLRLSNYLGFEESRTPIEVPKDRILRLRILMEHTPF